MWMARPRRPLCLASTGYEWRHSISTAHLRVRSVTGESGQQLSFIQEDKNDDFQFFVILPEPLAAGQKFSITTVYDGKDAVSNEGGGNYFPVARENWYPSNPGAPFGAYTDYDMTFRIPKGMRMAATGVLIKEDNEAGKTCRFGRAKNRRRSPGSASADSRLKKPS